MATPFVLSDETVENSHGFYLDNAGGQLDRFRENPVMLYGHNDEKVIGRWENIRFEGVKMLADADFDPDDDEAKKVQGKVERGYLRGASLGIGIIGAEKRYNEVTKREELHVTQWEAYEGSVVSIPSNSHALRLKIYDGTGRVLQDSEIEGHLKAVLKLSASSQNDNERTEFQNDINMDKINLTAEALVALGLSDTANPAAVSAAVVALHTACKKASDALATLKKEAEEAKEKAIQDMVDAAVATGQLKADQKNDMITLARTDIEAARRFIASLSAKKSLAEQLNSAKGSGASLSGDRSGWTFMDWLKQDGAGLQKMQAERPDEYKRLHDAYGN